jgi:CRP-like cAMP-binding protein
VVFDAGDPSTAAYVILRGRVEFERDGSLSSVLLPGDVFGELSVIHGTVRPGRAVVTEAAVMARLPADAVLAAARPPSAGRLTAESR